MFSKNVTWVIVGLNVLATFQFWHDILPELLDNDKNVACISGVIWGMNE